MEGRMISNTSAGWCSGIALALGARLGDVVVAAAAAAAAAAAIVVVVVVVVDGNGVVLFSLSLSLLRRH